MIMSSTGGDLPQQIIIDDILPRLPTKSLCRFKSVSKPWRALISDPHFLKAHLTRHTTTTPDTLILVSPSGSLFSLHFYQSLTATATKLDIPSPEHPIGWVHVFCYCNGLLLLSNKSESKFILNPSTRLYKKIPGLSYFADSHSNTAVMYGLGYDPSIDDYKVVRMKHYFVYPLDEDYGGPDVNATSFQVYGLKSSSWRDVKNYPYDSGCFKFSQLVFVNGSLGFCKWVSPLDWITNYELGSNVIAAFDLADETFRDVPPPLSLDNRKMSLYDLTVLGGSLCMFPCQNSEEINVWVMKEYGVVESWTEFKVIRPNNAAKIVPLCMLRDGEVLLETDGCELVAYNPEEGRGRVTVVHGYSGSITYVDSLVSPNGVARQDGAFRRRPNMDLSRLHQEIIGFLDRRTRRANL